MVLRGSGSCRALSAGDRAGELMAHGPQSGNPGRLNSADARKLVPKLVPYWVPMQPAGLVSKVERRRGASRLLDPRRS